MPLRQTRGEPYHPGSMPSRKRAVTTSSGRKPGPPPPIRRRIPVAVLGGTGTVGQRFVQRLEGHPWFEIVEIMASDQSAGRSYAEAVGSRWKLTTRIPVEVAKLRVRGPGDRLQARVLFSALDASVAGELEHEYASRGHFVSSNARNHRMDPKVPLVIPEVNRDHMEILDLQPYRNGGGLVTNPNCSTIVIAMALAPLHRAFGVDAAIVTTFQAVSGAGYPGVPSLDILGNVVPFIAGEEAKIESETQKILGRVGPKGIAHAEFPVSALCHRVPVIDGHQMAISLRFKTNTSRKRILDAWDGFLPLRKLGLPSAPEAPIEVRPEDDRPQPRLDADRAGGMGVTIGRLRPCPVLEWKFEAVGHNTIRGAAGAAILNAEILVRDERI
jgi:aspartate-semialdehyde dehydrogenase